VKPSKEAQAEFRRTQRWVHLVAWFVATVGLIGIFEAFLPREPIVFEWLEQFLPIDLSEYGRIGMYLSGFCLLAIARGLWRRKRAAWWIAVVLLSLTALLQLARGPDLHHAIPTAAILGLLIWRRRDYLAESDRGSIRWAFIIGIPLFIAVFAYGVFGLISLRGQVTGRGHLIGPVQTALELMFLQSTDAEIATTPRAANFFIQVSAGGMFCGLIMVVLLLRPVFEWRVASSTTLARVRKIIDQYGCDPLDEFALLPDKQFFFAPNERSFLAYALWRNFAVCLVGPVGPAEDRLSATRGFVRFCAAQDWQPIFYFARSELRPILSQCGLKSFKVGEDARLSVTDFNLKGGKFQNLRTACNKARKEGKELRWYQPGDGPFDYGLEAQLKVLSDEWLREKQGTEMAFDLGSFNLTQVRKRGVAAIFDADSKLEAFATWLPYKQGAGRSLDLMRSHSSAKGIMDFLIVESIDHFRERGVEEVSLGNAPLANTEQNRQLYGREEKAVKFLFEKFNRYYGYKSLFEFKKKYQPIWQGRFLGFRPNANLLLVAVALVRVHLPQGLIRILRS
jgi:phosphatidylglycerol lysyltransferase